MSHVCTFMWMEIVHSGVETETINLELVSDLCTASPYIVWPRYLKMPNFKRQIIHRFIYFLFFFPPSFRRISLHLSIILHMKIESFYRLAKQLLKVFFFFFFKGKEFRSASLASISPRSFRRVVISKFYQTASFIIYIDWAEKQYTIRRCIKIFD